MHAPEDNPHIDALTAEVDRLRRDVSELSASRRRLAVGADDDRRHIERALHDGVQQSLVAISMTLQLARQALGSAR